MINKIKDFETVLNGYYPTASDIRLTNLKKKYCAISLRYGIKAGLYKNALRIKSPAGALEIPAAGDRRILKQQAILPSSRRGAGGEVKQRSKQAIGHIVVQEIPVKPLIIFWKSTPCLRDGVEDMKTTQTYRGAYCSLLERYFPGGTKRALLFFGYFGSISSRLLLQLELLLKYLGRLPLQEKVLELGFVAAG